MICFYAMLLLLVVVMVVAAAMMVVIVLRCACTLDVFVGVTGVVS